MKKALGLGLALLLLAAGRAPAFNGATSSQGEASGILDGDYNCTTGNGTQLTLYNADALHGFCACVEVWSGFIPAPGSNLNFQGLVDVRDFDTDTIDVCSLLPGTAGKIEVVTFKAPGINSNCTSFRNNPVEGGVYGSTTDNGGKSELRVVPSGVESYTLAKSNCTASLMIPSSSFLNGSFE